ncbi:hypothetical protein HD554DRAFT_2022667 [Boletus coccyginus]|nr:hypothetical protein HD554DRAFT_2022667 [Boletus coccyginus]
MLRAVLLSLVATALVFHTLAGQVPLRSDYHGQDEFHRLGNGDWRLDRLPSPNTTDHLVFETVHSLLQHWPNTRMRNGHNIVPGSIPKGTLLYHGSMNQGLPPGPEWVATDPEHSYFYCREWEWESRPGRFQQGCWHLTLATTRPLKVIYFDGSSAVRLPYGSLDIQDLVAWGGLGRHEMNDDDQRIQDLCKWGKKFGVDGFVRMEMSFEVMLCDFTSGVSVVSVANLVNRGFVPPIIRESLSFGWIEVINAGSWHNHFPGETRIQLDLAGLVSFYDTKLAPSLVDIRAGQERWDHRVQNISSEDLSAVKSKLEANLLTPKGLSSGIDWGTLIRVIVNRYAGQLELTRYLLDSSVTDPDEILDLANKTQSQLRTMLTPYLLLSATPTDQSDRDELNWTTPIYKLCATTHTYSMDSEVDSMTSSEKLLLQAVRGTTREICRVVTKMWAAGVYAGLDRSLNTKKSPSIAEVTHLWNTWAEDLDRLMTWLDWNIWIKCNPGCGPDEMCYLPTWPFGFPRIGRRPPPPSGPDRLHPERLTSFDFRTMVMESIADNMRDIFKPDPDEWIRPQPKCVRRVEPYGF